MNRRHESKPGQCAALGATLVLAVSAVCAGEENEPGCLNHLDRQQQQTLEDTRLRIEKVAGPQYPTSLEAAHRAANAVDGEYVGCVVLSFEISEEGKAESILSVLEYPEGLFTRESVQALKASRFKPDSTDDRRWLIMYEFAVQDRVEDGRN